MTKESKIKGQVRLPRYVVRDYKVRKTFKAEPIKRKHGIRNSVKLKNISPSMRTTTAKVRPGVRM